MSQKFGSLMKQVAALEERKRPRRKVVFVQRYPGEDPQRVVARHLADRPGDARCKFFLFSWGVPPRPELCTAESVGAALAKERASIARLWARADDPPSRQTAQWHEREWRALCERFGLDYGAPLTPDNCAASG